MSKIKSIIQLIDEKKVLALIFIVALVLRFVAVFNLPSQYQILRGDALEYDALATNLLAGKGYIDYTTGLPTSFRVPVYPTFLALLYLIFGHNYIAVRLIQSIMGALLCVIIFYIGKTIFNKKIALLSAIMLACYQPYIFYSYFGGPAFILAESLFTFLLAIFLLYLINGFLKNPGLKSGIISGILLGLTSLTRPIIGMFALFIVPLLVYKNKFLPNKLFWKKILSLLAGFLLLILPWTLRNYYVQRGFIPFSTEGGVALLGGNNPFGIGTPPSVVDDLCLTQEEKNQLGTLSEFQKDKMYRRHAIEFLFKHYKKVPALFFKKLLLLWDVYITDYDINYRTTRRYNIWYSIVFTFCLFGIANSIKSKWHRTGILLLISLFTYLSVIALIFSGEPRFRYPIEPYLIIFASAGITSIYYRFRNKFLSYLVIGAVIYVNLLLYVFNQKVLGWARYLFRLIGLP